MSDLYIPTFPSYLLQVVRDAISAGVDGYDSEIKKEVRKAAHGLRLTREAAMSIASKAVTILLLLSILVCRFTSGCDVYLILDITFLVL